MYWSLEPDTTARWTRAWVLPNRWRHRLASNPNWECLASRPKQTSIHHVRFWVTLSSINDVNKIFGAVWSLDIYFFVSKIFIVFHLLYDLKSIISICPCPELRELVMQFTYILTKWFIPFHLSGILMNVAISCF